MTTCLIKKQGIENFSYIQKIIYQNPPEKPSTLLNKTLGFSKSGLMSDNNSFKCEPSRQKSTSSPSSAALRTTSNISSLPSAFKYLLLSLLLLLVALINPCISGPCIVKFFN